jgi:hypothetical protein
MMNEDDIESMVDYHYKFTTIQKILKTYMETNSRYNQLIDYLDL